MRIYDDIWHENVWELDLRFEIYQSKGSLFQDAQLRRPHLIGRQNCRRHGWSLGAPVIAGPAIWKKGQSHTHMIPKNIPTRISIYLWHTYIYNYVYTLYIHDIPIPPFLLNSMTSRPKLLRKDVPKEEVDPRAAQQLTGALVGFEGTMGRLFGHGESMNKMKFYMGKSSINGDWTWFNHSKSHTMLIPCCYDTILIAIHQ